MFNDTVAAFDKMEAITVNPMFKNSSFMFCIESFKGKFKLNVPYATMHYSSIFLAENLFFAIIFILKIILGGGEVSSDLIIPPEMNLQKTKTDCIRINDSALQDFDSHK